MHVEECICGNRVDTGGNDDDVGAGGKEVGVGTSGNDVGIGTNCNDVGVGTDCNDVGVCNGGNDVGVGTNCNDDVGTGSKEVGVGNCLELLWLAVGNGIGTGGNFAFFESSHCSAQ